MSKKDFRKQISEEFIKTLEEAKISGKTLDWKTPWFSGVKPHSGAYHRPYRGINAIWLRYISARNHYDDPRWYTFNQIKKMGCSLQKGTKGTTVEYWYPYDCTDQKKIKWSEKDTLEAEGHRIALYTYYNTVFNGTCITGLEPWKPEEQVSEVNPDDLISKISKGMDVEVIEDQLDRAYYSTTFDEIHLPMQKFFRTSEDYNATALHELTHSTGHKTRLNREIQNSFASEEYAFEELIAEIGSAMASEYLEGGLGETQFDNSTAYLGSWIKGIQDNPDALPKAIKMAEKAADYMLLSAGIKRGEISYDQC